MHDREIIRLRQELELARERYEDEKVGLDAVKALCVMYGHNPCCETLFDWLEERLKDSGWQK
jgi:hypothetical protein